MLSAALHFVSVVIGSFSTDVAGDVNKAGVDRLDEAPQASMQLKTDRSHTIFHSGFNVMVWLGEFQRKGEVELCFLEQFYIKGMSWHKIKHGGGETTGIITAASFVTLNIS